MLETRSGANVYHGIEQKVTRKLIYYLNQCLILTVTVSLERFDSLFSYWMQEVETKIEKILCFSNHTPLCSMTICSLKFTQTILKNCTFNRQTTWGGISTSRMSICQHLAWNSQGLFRKSRSAFFLLNDKRETTESSH